MKAYLNRIATALFALVVAGGLAFGGSQVLSSPAAPPCTGPDALGECPPFDNQSCEDACIQEGAVTGECGPGDCCRCKF